MAQKSYFFDSVDHDRIYSTADFARVFGAIAGRDGVIYGYGDELAVAPGSGMAVTVGTGAAFVRGRMLEVYSGAETLSIATADATNPRIDRVVVRVDLSSSERRAYLAVKTGTPAATPAAPLLQQDSTIWEMSLAQVRVGAGVTGITVGDITDEREMTSLSDGATAATTLYTPGVAGFDVATVQAGLDILAGGRIVDHNLDVANPPNGYYMRGEDGWQVCFIVKSWQQSVDIPFSSFFITQIMTWHYPASFVEVPAMAGCAYMGESNAPRWLGAGTSNILSQWNFWVMSTAIGESTTQGARLIAIGRWK